MKTKINLLLLLLTLPLFCNAQFLGIAGQYTDTNNGQFVATLQYPTFHKKNPLNTFITSGIEYTTGAAPISGLNIKPISIATFFSESFFNKKPYTVLLGCDTGYLFNFGHGKNGIIITPNLYADYKFFFIKTGYDLNVTANQQQFFVRVGVSFGLGAIKSFGETRIW